MAHFLETCVRFNEVLVAVHDAMFSLKIKKKERDALFTAQNLYILQLMHDVRDLFTEKCLSRVDKSSQLVSSVYQIATQTADSISNRVTPKAEDFLVGLFFDNNGNLTVNVKIEEENHQLLLNNHSKPKRSQTRDETLALIKEGLKGLKT